MESLIAIVDDDRGVCEALQRMLKSYGFDVMGFASAEQFLVSDRRETISCLIADVRMPGMSGLALQHCLIAERCPIPTILITACPTSGEREQAIAAGAVSYLAKPLSEHILLWAVREALETRRHAAN